MFYCCRPIRGLHRTYKLPLLTEQRCGSLPPTDTRSTQNVQLLLTSRDTVFVLPTGTRPTPNLKLLLSKDFFFKLLIAQLEGAVIGSEWTVSAGNAILCSVRRSCKFGVYLVSVRNMILCSVRSCSLGVDLVSVGNIVLCSVWWSCKFGVCLASVGRKNKTKNKQKKPHTER